MECRTGRGHRGITSGHTQRDVTWDTWDVTRDVIWDIHIGHDTGGGHTGPRPTWDATRDVDIATYTTGYGCRDIHNGTSHGIRTSRHIQRDVTWDVPYVGCRTGRGCRGMDVGTSYRTYTPGRHTGYTHRDVDIGTLRGTWTSGRHTGIWTWVCGTSCRGTTHHAGQHTLSHTS